MAERPFNITGNKLVNLPGKAAIRAGYDFGYDHPAAMSVALNWGDNSPGEFRLPTFDAVRFSPLGDIRVGTNDGNPNIFADYYANEPISALMRAYRQILYKNR